MRRAEAGDRSEGFITTQLPAAMAEMAGVRLRWKGKFQAPILRHPTDVFRHVYTPFGAYKLPLAHMPRPFAKP